VISGHHGTCGRVREGENWHCWGRNVETQLETSKPGDFAIPTEQRHWAPQTMVLGGYTGCGIIFVEEGQSETKCWGSNYHQALGANASGEGTYFPLWVDWKELNFQTLGISQFHGCGIAASGEMYCWGANYNGEVGMDPRLSAGAPRRVEARTDYVSVAAGFHHTCGLTEAGEIRCWGANAYGQLGRNATPAWGDPETIASEAVYVELVAGQYSTCARTAEGEVHCWGSRELFGGPTGSTIDVEPIVFGGQWDEIALYDQTLCALRDGEVSCAGRNMNGLISSGAPQLLSAFLQIPTEVEVTAVSMGSEHFCVLDAQGRAHCKGSNYSGELGDGAMVEHLEPYPAHRDL